MRNYKISFRRLFSNTKFLVVFSIVIAFIFWIVVAIQYAPIIDNVVENVPVKIDIENSVPDKLGLQIFGNSSYTVDITVRGNRYDIGGDLITADDFDVVAQTAYVDSSGNHTLKIKATAKDTDADYEIISVSAEYIEVYFDRYDEKEIEVTPLIVSGLSDLTDPDYMFNEDEMIYATKTVTISGAKTEVDKIKSAYAEIDLDDKLVESTTIDAAIRLDNGTSYEVKYVKINGESALSVPVTLPVYKIQELPVSVAFKNSPTELLNNPISYTCSPSTVKVAIMQNGTNNDKTLEVGTIDFSEISSVNSVFEFKASDLVDVKILDGTKTFNIKLDMTSYTEKALQLNPSAVRLTGAENSASIDVTLENSGQINVCGKAEYINALSDSDISGVINLNGVTVSENGTRVPVTVTIKDKNNSWVTGTYFAVIRSN